MWIESYVAIAGFISLALGEIVILLLIKSMWEDIEVLQKQHDYIRGEVHEVRQLIKEKESQAVQG